MPLVDDKDIVRAIGYVTIYTSYVEEAIDECLKILKSRDPLPPKKLDYFPSSQKIEYLRAQIEKIGSLPTELSSFSDVLNHAEDLIERRNEYVHGRLYGSLQGEKDVLRPGRPNGTQRQITSAELYDLANELLDCLVPLNHASFFSLKRLSQ